MKRTVMLVWGLVMSLLLQAQQVHTKHNEKLSHLSAASVTHGYGCPVCSWNSPARGKCIFHDVELVPDGWYYCKTDISVIYSQPGKCTRCGNEMVKMVTGRFAPSAARYAMVQDTSRKQVPKPEEGYDPAKQKQLRKDPDNRIRNKPKSQPDSTAAPGRK